MTPEEIRRDYQGSQPCYEPSEKSSVANAQIQVLSEIAAQLAELNANLKPRIEPVFVADAQVNLYKAAPEMYEALKDALEAFRALGIAGEAHYAAKVVKAAIAKAEGSGK